MSAELAVLATGLPGPLRRVCPSLGRAREACKYPLRCAGPAWPGTAGRFSPAWWCARPSRSRRGAVTASKGLPTRVTRGLGTLGVSPLLERPVVRPRTAWQAGEVHGGRPLSVAASPPVSYGGAVVSSPP